MIDTYCIVCDEPILPEDSYWEFEGESWCDRCVELDKPGQGTRVVPAGESEA